MREFYAPFRRCQAMTSLFDTFRGTPDWVGGLGRFWVRAADSSDALTSGLPANLIENIRGYNIHWKEREPSRGIGIATP